MVNNEKEHTRQVFRIKMRTVSEKGNYVKQGHFKDHWKCLKAERK